MTHIALATAQPIAAYFSEWSGRGVPEAQRALRSSGPVTPAPGTFAIWGPLFLESLRYAAWSADEKRRGRASLRHAGWLVSAALASNTAWSLNAQLRGLGWASTGIIALGASSATAALLTAARNADRDPAARQAARSTAPLAGWLTLASFANLEATLNETRGRPAPRIEESRAILLLSAATVTAGAVALIAKGNPLYSGAVAWGLGGTVTRNLREGRGSVAAVAGAGIAALAAITAVARARAAAERAKEAAEREAAAAKRSERAATKRERAVHRPPQKKRRARMSAGAPRRKSV